MAKKYKGVPTLFDEDDNLIEEEQNLDEADQALLDLIYERLDIFSELNGDFHKEAEECRQVLHMQDPKQDDAQTEEENGKETLQLQTLKSTINNVVADQMLSMPEAKLLPETSAQEDVADDLQDMVHYVVYCANDFEQVHYSRCEDFYGTGTAVMQQAWDQDMNHGKGEIAIIRWPLESFLWDPMAEYVQDCRAVMKVSWHPLSWFVEHWPKEGRYVGSEDGEHDNVGKTAGQLQTEHQNDEERAMLIEYWWRTYDASTRKYSINVAYAAGGALLEVHEDVYWHGMYPFVIDIHDRREGSLPGKGLVQELRSMMQYINRYAAYADMNARMSSKGRILTKRESGIDKDALTDWKVDVIEGNRIVQGDDWNWLSSPPFNRTIVDLMTMFESDLKADSGANQFTRGETTGGIVSGKAINSLIQAGGKISSMRTEQLKYGFKQMVEQILWLMAQFYDDGRVMMITGRKGKREITVDTKKMFGVKGKGAIPPPPYTVQIEISSKDPQRIANQNQMFMEAYSMAAQTPYPIRLSSLIKICNIDGKDRILPLIEADEKYGEQMQIMQQQMEQMQAQMQKLQEENDVMREAVDDTTDSMQQMAARRGGQAPVSNGGQMKVATAGGGDQNTNAIASAARNTLGLPTGAALPT